MAPPTEYELLKWRRLLLVRDSRAVNPTAPEALQIRLGICVLCGDSVFYRLNQLQAHHIHPKSLFPELALDLDNGVMVCAGHHQGIVHFHNADLDVTENAVGGGWRVFVPLFERYVSLARQRRFNLENQPKLLRKG